LIELGDDISIYQNNNKINISHFNKFSQYIPNEIKQFNYNQLARRMINDENVIYILIQKYENNSILNNSIFVYDIITGYENVIILEDDLVRINSIKIINIRFSYKNEDNYVKYLVLCGEKNSQGILYVYKINGLNLSITTRLYFNNPINDFCLCIDHIILAKENTICSIKIEKIDSEQKINFIPINEQKHLNKVF